MAFVSERSSDPRLRQSPTDRFRSRARGAFLLEALIGMLIFAVAAAGVVSLVASAVRAGTDADLRSAATALAAATLARMATDDFATLAERYEASRDGAGYRALATRARLLPGVTTSVNLPSLSITDGPSISSRRVDVVVSWQPPGAARPHRASMTTVIAR
jgi:Tfp pilus assembly protein PilV